MTESRLRPTPGPLRNGAFRWFFLGRAVSFLGSGMAPVALAFAVLDATGSAVDVGIVLAARSIPFLLFVLIGGVMADRFPRRTVLLLSNLGAASTQGAVAVLLVTGAFSLPAVAALELVNGVLTAFTSPALRGIVPELVDVDQRQRANSLLSLSKNIASILGPSVAGAVVIAVGGGWAIAFDAFTYLFAALCMAPLRSPEPVRGSPSNFLREIREGWVGFRSLRWFCAIVVAFAVTNCIYAGIWTVLGPTIASTTIGAASWGVVLSARAIGTLIASAAMYRPAKVGSLPAGLLFYSLGALPMVMLGLQGGMYLLVPAAFAAGVGHGVMAITWETSVQTYVPNTMLSRITAYDDLVAFAAVPVGQVAVAPVAAAWGDMTTMVVGGVLFGLVVVAPILLRSVRRPDELAGTGSIAPGRHRAEP